jgi:hypothetical protein
MKQLLVELHTPGDTRDSGDFFILELPSPGEPEFYRQVSSWSWFRERELNRAFPDVSSGKLIKGLNWAQYARTIKYCSEHSGYVGTPDHETYLKERDIDITTIPVCKNVWDFYDMIGYDRKTKKYKG